MKKKWKIIFVIIQTVLLIFILSNNLTVNARKEVTEQIVGMRGDTLSVDTTDIIEIVRDVLGLIRMLTGLFSIIIIAYAGFEFVTETPEGKKKIKEKMLPIVLGILLTFSATTIAIAIVGIFEK